LTAGLHCLASDRRLISDIHIAKDPCGQTQPRLSMQHEFANANPQKKEASSWFTQTIAIMFQCFIAVRSGR
jgi:hypothetical protein